MWTVPASDSTCSTTTRSEQLQNLSAETEIQRPFIGTYAPVLDSQRATNDAVGYVGIQI